MPLGVYISLKVNGLLKILPCNISVQIIDMQTKTKHKREQTGFLLCQTAVMFCGLDPAMS